jgi:hypothetical protein
MAQRGFGSKLYNRLAQHPRVEYVDGHESGCEDWLVTLRIGFRFADIGEHVRGFQTLSEAMREIRSVSICTCDYCLSNGKTI